MRSSFPHAIGDSQRRRRANRHPRRTSVKLPLDPTGASPAMPEQSSLAPAMPTGSSPGARDPAAPPSRGRALPPCPTSPVAPYPDHSCTGHRESECGSKHSRAPNRRGLIDQRRRPTTSGTGRRCRRHAPPTPSADPHALAEGRTPSAGTRRASRQTRSSTVLARALQGDCPFLLGLSEELCRHDRIGGSCPPRTRTAGSM
jgi:hypothetical protein